VPVDQIVVGANVRRDVGNIDDLTESVRQLGVLQPLVCVASADGGRIELLMGQRRLAAARAAGLTTVPCLLRSRPAPRERILMQLAENHQRADMSPVDEACAFADLLGAGMIRTQIARTIRRSISYVRRRLELWELPDVLRVAVDVGWVSVETAVSVIPRRLLDDPTNVAELARVVRDGDQAVRAWLLRPKTGPARNGAGRRRSTEGEQFVVRVRPDVKARAVADARRRQMTLAEWFEDLIERHVPEDRPDRPG
jgi:ParB/RepB/Spo0J family partition protein